MYSKEWIERTIKEIVRDLNICTKDDLTSSQTDIPAGSEVSFNLDTAHADFTSPPPDGTDSGFGFGHNDISDAYDMDTPGIFLPT